MSSTASDPSETVSTDWLWDLLDHPPVEESERAWLHGRDWEMVRGVLRDCLTHTASQQQTRDVFAYKWHRRETFESDASLERMREWLLERYGHVGEAEWWREYGERPLLVDVGCGAGMSALELFGDRLKELRYLGVDVSEALDVAAERFHDRGYDDAAFLQTDLQAIPLAEGSVDVLFAEGVLHHTDSTQKALTSVAKLLRPGGRILFYVYREKGPIREFTDDYIRSALGELSPEAGWEALLPLSRLGQALGELDVEIDVPEAIDLLGIPAGRLSLQRFFYWHVFKAFYHPGLTLDEMHHINYDWYAPRNAHRQSLDEVRAWCADAGLVVEREHAEPAGITIQARKAS